MSVIFVFYKLNGDHSWEYNWNKIPAGWDWTGAGHVDKNKQFNGPSKNKSKMREYLDN